MSKPILDSELILNPDGSVYHLHLLPEQIATTIITVGDPDRVEAVSQHFDEIECKVHKREFITHTGRIGSKRLTVISTGIGTDNIDICMNELDALVNIDLKTRQIKDEHTQLTFVRVGTSGCLDKTLSLDSFLASAYGIGMDGLMNYYDVPYSADELALQQGLNQHVTTRKYEFPLPITASAAHSDLRQLFGDLQQGITLTATGFYAPQGRQLRLKSRANGLFDVFDGFAHDGIRVTNFEMETAAIYGLANSLGHRAISLNALIANRVTGQFSANPYQTVQKLIQYTIEKLA